MAVGLLSLPTELICHILLFLTPEDICRCAIICKIVWGAAQNSVHIQYKLELYAQGLNETDSADADSIAIARKMSSLKNLASLWRSGFHVNTVFQDVVASNDPRIQPQSMKCGTLWVWRMNTLLVRDCKDKTKTSQVWPKHDLFKQSVHIHNLVACSVVVDPLQDLVVAISAPSVFHSGDAQQDHPVCWVDFWQAHPGFRIRTLQALHWNAGMPVNLLHFSVICIVGGPAICGDRVVMLYYTRHRTSRNTVGASNMFIQLIDWRKGRVKRHALSESGEPLFYDLHLVDKHTLVIIDSKGRIILYTLQGLDDTPRHRITYLLPILKPGRNSAPQVVPHYVVYASPSFHGTVAHPDLMPSYVPSMESQIMVLETLPASWPVIMVIDMAMFSEKAIQSETRVEIPWSDWGTQVYMVLSASSKPPNHGSTLHRGTILPTHCSLRNIHDPNLPGVVIRKPVWFAQSCLDEDFTSNRPYMASVCAEPFSMHYLDRIFLEQDRLTVTRSPPSLIDIQVFSPVPMEVSLEPERHREKSF
ncbi:uncharacterized protein EDB93DRAFT_1179126 [Suillus bovinus]|uniref:uncharacterized protein n=1 Tax=Suillus bovinus TaxID=48563 RepID=UPI001B861B31|nr:uncharacterized protein EDB93DRAFT_1179126 [Suillus bovinus]KAG2130838.1 hypothetical protein EDB93DRAFT_1179126 [Suillus bovinus]